MKKTGIYILAFPNGKQYVGKSVDLDRRVREHISGIGGARLVKHAIKKFGTEAVTAEIIEYPGISPESLNAVEQWKIAHLKTKTPHGYNITVGGDGSDSKTVSDIQCKRVQKGTHNFLGGAIQRKTNRKRVENGTHHFIGGEIARKSHRKRLEDGTHHLLGGDIQRKNNLKRVKDGTHNFLGGEIQRKRIKDGTHNFFGGEIQRKTNLKRWAAWRERKREAEVIIAYAFYHARLQFNYIIARKEWNEIPDLANSKQSTFL